MRYSVGYNFLDQTLLIKVWRGITVKNYIKISKVLCGKIFNTKLERK